MTSRTAVRVRWKPYSPAAPGFTADLVVHHAQDMRVPADEQARPHGPDAVDDVRGVVARVAADVGHQHGDLLAREGQKLRVDAAREAAVDVARDGAQGLEGGDAVGQLERADVARVPDFVYVTEKLPQPLVERAVRVRKDAYAFHRDQYLPFQSVRMRSAIFASAAFCSSGS